MEELEFQKQEEEQKVFNLPSLSAFTSFNSKLLTQNKDQNGFVWMPPSFGVHDPIFLPDAQKNGELISSPSSPTPTTKQQLPDLNVLKREVLGDMNPTIPPSSEISTLKDVNKDMAYGDRLSTLLDTVQLKPVIQIGNQMAKEIFIVLENLRQQEIFSTGSGIKTKESILSLCLVNFGVGFKISAPHSSQAALEEVCRSFLAFTILLEKQILFNLDSSISYKTLLSISTHLVGLKSLFLRKSSEPVIAIFKKQFSMLWEDLVKALGNQSKACIQIGAFSRECFSRLKTIFPDVVTDCNGKHLRSRIRVDENFKRTQTVTEVNDEILSRLDEIFFRQKRKTLAKNDPSKELEDLLGDVSGMVQKKKPKTVEAKSISTTENNLNQRGLDSIDSRVEDSYMRNVQQQQNTEEAKRVVTVKEPENPDIRKRVDELEQQMLSFCEKVDHLLDYVQTLQKSL